MKRLMLGFAVAALFVLPATAVSGSSPKSVSGDFAVTSLVPVSVEQKSSNVCIIEAQAEFSFTGDATGAFTADFRIVRHGSCDLTEPAPDRFVARGTYTGSVLGSEGSFDFVFRGGVDEQGIAEGKLTVLQGQDELASLQGSLLLTGQAGIGGSYSGRVHFDP